MPNCEECGVSVGKPGLCRMCQANGGESALVNTLATDYDQAGSAETDEPRVECPKCREMIKPGAARCPFCRSKKKMDRRGSHLAASMARGGSRESRALLWAIPIACAVAILSILLLLALRG